MRDVHPPCFGFLTVKNRKKGGDKPERGAFFLLNLMHVPDRPDIIAVTTFCDVCGRVCFPRSDSRNLRPMTASPSEKPFGRCGTASSSRSHTARRGPRTS